jgi:hypothetical protein
MRNDTRQSIAATASNVAIVTAAAKIAADPERPSRFAVRDALSNVTQLLAATQLRGMAATTAIAIMSSTASESLMPPSKGKTLRSMFRTFATGQPQPITKLVYSLELRVPLIQETGLVTLHISCASMPLAHSVPHAADV